MSPTTTLERTSEIAPKLGNPNLGHPKLFHWVRKDKVTKSIVEGTFVVALCGVRFPVTEIAKPGSPLCPRCVELLKVIPGMRP